MSYDLLIELVTQDNHILELVGEHRLLQALVVLELSFRQEVETGTALPSWRWALPLIITEGEFKTLALWRLANWHSDHLRFLPVGVSGVYNWRGTIERRQDRTATAWM